MTDHYPVYVVDDDAGLRNSLRFMLTNDGRVVRSFDSGESFLAELEDFDPGPILLDVRMKNLDGFDVLEELARRDCAFPVVILTGHGDIPMAVRAMKGGAIDFLTKPFARRDMLTALGHADERLQNSNARGRQRGHAEEMLKALSKREMQVLNELARGLPNKSIACDLGISPRTVEVHRANVMRKLGKQNFPDALRVAFAAGLPISLSSLLSEAEEPRLPLEAGGP